jgi:hypothetical protein
VWKRFQATFLLLGGIGLMVTGVWVAVADAGFLGDSLRADGAVVDLATQRVRGMTLYRPVVRYLPVGSDGPVEFTAKPGLWPSPYEVGDEVVVAYRSEDPLDARVVSFWMLWLMPLLSTGVGGGCLFAGWHETRQLASRKAQDASPGGSGGAVRRAGSAGLISPTALPLGSSTIA